jgi:hypothetical protein
VTQWRDKSGNARHLGVGSGTTSYSSNAIQLASSYMFVTSPVDLSKVTVFIVVKTPGGYNHTVFSGRPNTAADYDSLDGFGFYMDNQTAIRFYGQSANLSTFSVNTSTPQLFSFQSSGTSISGWLNGTSQSGGTLSSSRTSTAQGFAIGASWYGTSYGNIVANALLYEIVVYNSALTTSQRQQVEGYLAHKWGLTGYYNSSIPLSIPGCALWLDAADTSSITLSGSSVTQWRDKSTIGNHFTQTNTTNSPTIGTSANGLSTMYFDTTNKQLTSSQNNATPGNTSRTVIQVIWAPTLTSAWYTVTGTESLGDPPPAYGFAKNPNADVNYPFVYSTTGMDIWTTVNSTPNPIIIYTQYNSSTSVLSGYYATGSTTLGGFVTKSTTMNTTAGVWYLGKRQQAGTGSVTSHLFEMIQYDTVLTTSQRQMIEGYLVRKWGLTTLYPALPSTHPFYSIRPHLRTFQPIDVPGCQLWLDGADQSSMTLSGSSVTQIRDKSGNGNNSTSSTAAYTTTGINGLGCILNPTTISGPITNSGSSVVDFFIVATLSAASGPFYNMLALNAASVGNYYGAGSLFACYYGGKDPPQFYAFMNGNLSLSSTGAVNTPYIFNAFQSGTTGTTVFNGTSQGAVATPGNTFTYTNYYIGAVGGAPAWLGNIGEILVFNSVLTTTQRQQVEGYLAHKWGMSASLPATHPFKSFPPASLYFEPATKYSALFNNTSLTIPSSSSVTLGTNNHTIEFWAYQTSRGQYDCPFQYSINTSAFSTSSYYMALGGYLGILIGNNAGNFAINMGATVSPLPSLNRWHHYAIVRNGTTFTIYINGISRETATSSVSIGAQGGSFIFGDVSTTTTTPFFGYITNFRLVNGTAVYTSNFIPSTSPLTAIPNTQILLQGLTDRSTNAFTVTNNRGVTLSTLSPFPPP